MRACEQLNTAIDAYIEEFKQVQEKASPAAGLFGFGSGPDDHPCHMAFYERIQEMTKGFLASGLGAEDAFSTVELLLKSHQTKDCPNTVKLMLVAVQKFAVPLIPMLSHKDSEELLKWYDSFVPRQTRMPVERDVARALKKNASIEVN